ncbi:AMP-binding protein [Nostocoides sp. F2B08]|uniref:AMP-binding enzyme n=1 Tax=Nostocoides sp. F2B08 TaxID=2653936 RepID=UPI00186AD8BE|nr:AMP-binding protein [Tetrasphaera sp. F2B08]
MSWTDVLSRAGYWDGGELLRVPTSGTTGGSPRVVVRTVESWVDSFEPFTRISGISDTDVVAAVGPSSSMFVYARAHAAHLGARLVESERWHPGAIADATVAHLTPTMLHDVLEAQRDVPVPLGQGGLRLAVVAGAALGARTAARAGHVGIDVLRYYGAAELSFVAMGRERLSPFPMVEVAERAGVLWVRSPWTADGYADGASGPLLRDGRWCTVGDRGTVSHDGVVVVHGREGWVVTGGLSVSTAEIESVLREAPGVTDCRVLGRPHDRLGQVIAAVVVGGERAQVSAHCRSRLPVAARPVHWFAADRLPATSAGKPDDAAIVLAIETGEVRRWS